MNPPPLVGPSRSTKESVLGSLKSATSGKSRKSRPSSGNLSGVKRRLFNLFTYLSLIFCVATCILWARNSDSFHIPATTGSRQLIFASGAVNYDRIEYLPRLQGRALITHHVSVSDWMLAFALALPVLAREAMFRYFPK